MQGSLFTQDFLKEGITETEVWRALEEPALTEFHARVSATFEAFPLDGHPNEAVTERNLIDPILETLGWEHFLVQQSAGAGRSDVPDYLLLENADAFARANSEDAARRYRHGTSFLEAKRWQRPLDRRGEADLLDDEVPSTKTLQYLSRVEVTSEKRISWGILTNGRHWRLYYQGARSRSEEFLELDLPLLAAIPGLDTDLFSPDEDERARLLRLFLLMFRRDAFLPTEEGERTFHELALDEGRLWESQVADDLSVVVFDKVFPALVQGLARHDPQDQKAFGRYLTKDLILAYMNAVEAGDFDTVVAI